MKAAHSTRVALGSDIRPLIALAAFFVVTSALAQTADYSSDPSGNLSARTGASSAKPQIIGQPQVQVVEPGELASFAVVLADASGASYQWQCNGTNIVGATGDALLLTNVGITNQGQYQVVITNSFGSVTSAPAALLIDSHGGGMPDSWQMAYFGNLNQNPLGDYDRDGVSNLQEWLDGTNPTNNASRDLRLTIMSDGGVVALNPFQLSYTNGQSVALAATPISPNSFFGWAGDLVARTNPAALLMNADKNVRACFLCQPAVAGLVGWWRGEVDASDFVGGHHGTSLSGVNIMAPSITATGMVGSAFVFYGTNHIQVPDGVDLKPAQFTIEAWVYPAVQNNTYQTVLAKGSAVNDDDAYYLGVVNGGASFWTKNSGSMGQLAGGAVPANQWTHLAATFDGSSRRLYVNGILIGAQGSLGPLTYDSASVPLTIGADWTANSPACLFNGMLDEVSLFNRALSQAEITGLYIANAAGKCMTRPIFISLPQFANAKQGSAYTQQVTTVLGTLPVTFSISAGSLPAGLSLSTSGQVSGVPTTPGSNVFAVLATDAIGLSTELICSLTVLPTPQQVPAMPAGIVSWWRAENDALDSIGANNGTLSNGVTFAAGEVGQAFSFSGALNQQVKLAGSPSLNVGTGSGLTIEAWIKPSNITNQMPLVEWNDGSTTGWGSHFWINVGFSGQGGPGCLYANLRDVNLADHSFFSPTALLSTSVWQHVALTYDATLGVGQLFLNGTAVATANLGFFVPQTAPNLYLGFRPNQASYAGLLDEIALYNRALTTNEMAAIYSAGPLGKVRTSPYLSTLSGLPDAVLGVGYAQAISAVSAAGPLSYTLDSGTLPSGLTLNASGLLSGVPSDVGGFTFAVKVTDTNNLSTVGSFSIQVYAPVPPPPGLLGWWRAESNAFDELSLHNGTLVRNVTYAPGRVGTAFKLDGNSYVDLGVWTAGSNWTIEAWAKPASLPGGRHTIVGGINNCVDYGLEMTDGQFGVQIKPPGGCSAFIPSGIFLTIGSWYHVAAACDGLNASVYVNGVLAGSAPVQFNYVGDATGLRIGSSVCCGDYFPGYVDDVAIYKRPLTASEIAGLYTAGAGGKSPSGPAFATQPVLPTAVLGQSYNQTVATARGAAPITLAVTGDNLPPGLSLSPAGLLSGTPLSTGNYNFTVTATDSSGLTGSQTFSLQVLSMVPPPAGLISWWRSESNALDSIGDNNGIPINNATYAPGKVDQAFAFSGANDAVEFLDAPSLHPSSVTLEAWVTFFSGGGTQFIISKTVAGTSDSYALWLQNGNLYGMVSAISGANNAISVPFTPNPGQWYHVALTFDDATKQQFLYLNGVAVAFNISNLSIGYDNHPVYLGANVNGTLGSFINGRIDEASIYNRALSAAEIAAVYGADAAGKTTLGPYITTPPTLPEAAFGVGYTQSVASARGNGQVLYSLTHGALPTGLSLNAQGVLSGVMSNAGLFSFTVRATDAAGLYAEQGFSLLVSAPVTPPAGLVSWWRAENNALDSAGTNHGTALNATSYASGKAGQAFALDGFSGCVLIPDSPSLRAATFTLESWVRFDANTGTQVIIAKPLGGAYLDSFAIWLENGALKAALANPSGWAPSLATAFTPVVGQWYHVAYTFDELTRQQVLYLNNTTVASGLTDRSVGYDNQPLLLGCDGENGSRDWFVQGRIDEAALYDRALTATEVASLYNASVAGKTTSGPYFISVPPLPDAVMNQGYPQTLVSARGTAPISYTVLGGSLPPGLTLTSTGAFSGAPTGAGKFTFTARVTDSSGLFADQSYTISVFAPVSAPSGLIAWWRAETNALDSASTNKGTLAGGAAFTAGKVGSYAFSFDGSTGYVDTPLDAQPSALPSTTWEAWVYPTRANAGRQEILSTDDGGYDRSVLVQDASFGIFTGAGVWTPAAVIPNRWQHIAAVFTPTNIEFYANGVRSSYGAAPVGQNTARRLRIGASPAFGEYYQGFADEVSIYNRALSASEITAIYNAGVAGKVAGSSLPPLLLGASAQGGVLTLSFPTAIGVTYTVQSEPSLGTPSWSVVTNVTALNSNVFLSFPLSAPQLFYRVVTSGH
jgi:hypothetical protein